MNYSMLVFDKMSNIENLESKFSKELQLNKVMVLFLPIMGWSFLGRLGWSDGSDRRITCNLHKKGDSAGVCRPPLQWLSQFLSYEKEIIQLFRE